MTNILNKSSVENPQNEHMYITLKSATSYMLHKYTMSASVCEVPFHMITLHSCVQSNYVLLCVCGIRGDRYLV